MNHQLSYDLLTDASKNPSVHFRGVTEVNEVVEELQAEGAVSYSIDGAQINSHEDLYRLFAAAFEKPEPWYGSAGFVPNINTFLDILDGARELIDAKAHIVVLRNATRLWHSQTAVAGDLTEWWQIANMQCGANIHLVFQVE